MKTDKTTESKPPYVAYKTFSNFVASLRESGLPNRIDRSVLPGLSGATQSFLLAALKFLGLINDEGAPSATLKDLVENTHTEQSVLAKIVKEKYGFIFNAGFNINSATDAELSDKFRERELGGSTIRKAVSFFTSLCEAAGIKLSPHLKAKRASTGTTITRKYKKRKIADDVLPIVPPATTTAPKTFREMLLDKFPAFNPTWDAETSKKWFENFEKLMDSDKKSESKQ